MKIAWPAKLKSLFGPKGFQSRGPLSGAKRDMRYGLVLALLVFILSAVLHYVYYIGVLGTEAPTDKSTYPDIMVKELKSVILKANEKQRDFEALVSEAPTPIDPG